MSKEKNENAQLFGAIERFLYWVDYTLHILSFFSGSVWAYGWITGHMGSYGFQIAGLVSLLCISASLLMAAAIETGHAIIPRILAWMLLRFRHTIKDASRVIVCIALIAITYGITLASQLTSSEGGKNAAKWMFEIPSPTDISPSTDQYRIDSAAIANEMQLSIAATEEKYAALVDSVKAAHKPAIDKYRKSQSHYLQVYNKAPGKHSWAKGESGNYRRRVEREEDERDAAIDKIAARGRAELSNQKLNYSQQLSSLGLAYRDNVSKIKNGDREAIEKAKADNLALQSMGVQAGYYLVLALLVSIFLRAGIQYASGKPMPVYSFEESNLLPIRIARSLSGLFTDKVSHITERLEATRVDRKERQEAKPFKFPSGRAFARSFSVLLVVFATMQLPEGKNTFVHFSVIPDGFKWPFAFLSALVALLAFWDRQNDRPNDKSDDKKEPVATDGDKSDKSVADTDENSEDNDNSEAETVGRQRLADFDESVATVTTAQIDTWKTQFRHSQIRQHTSAGRDTRDRHAKTFKSAKKHLSDLGYKFEKKGGYEGTHNIDGVPTLVTFDLYRCVS